MKLNKLGKLAALCVAGCMLLSGCGTGDPADKVTETGSAADVAAEKNENAEDTEVKDVSTEDVAAEQDNSETETEDAGVTIPEVVIEPKEIPDTDGYGSICRNALSVTTVFTLYICLPTVILSSEKLIHRVLFRTDGSFNGSIKLGS